MRRVAAKWVYRSEERLLDNAVVVLANDYVGNYYAIADDDMPTTEWLGGIIFLSSVDELNLPSFVTLDDLKCLLLDDEYTPRYAYHLSGIDLKSKDSFPSHLLVKLEDFGD